MKVLVTGSNGFLGREICRMLVAQEHQVLALDLQKTENVKNVESVQCDILDPLAVKKAMSGVQRVIHAAAVVPMRKAGSQYYGVNAEGTKSILEIAVKSGVEHFTYISSSAVYGLNGHDNGAANPTVNPLPAEAYGRSKLEGEKFCRSLQSDIKIGIVRPRTILGPGRMGIFSILFNRIRLGKNIFFLGDGSNPLQLISLDDVAQLTVTCSLNQISGIFNLGGHDPVSMRETLESLCNFAKTGSHALPLPSRSVKLALRTLDKLRLSPFAPWHYETLDQPMSLNTTITETKLGKCNVSSVQALLDTYSWYIDNLEQKADLKDRYSHREAAKPGIFRFF